MRLRSNRDIRYRAKKNSQFSAAAQSGNEREELEMDTNNQATSLRLRGDRKDGGSGNAECSPSSATSQGFSPVPQALKDCLGLKDERGTANGGRKTPLFSDASTQSAFLPTQFFCDASTQSAFLPPLHFCDASTQSSFLSPKRDKPHFQDKTSAGWGNNDSTALTGRAMSSCSKDSLLDPFLLTSSPDLEKTMMTKGNVTSSQDPRLPCKPSGQDLIPEVIGVPSTSLSDDDLSTDTETREEEMSTEEGKSAGWGVMTRSNFLTFLVLVSLRLLWDLYNGFFDIFPELDDKEEIPSTHV